MFAISNTFSATNINRAKRRTQRAGMFLSAVLLVPATLVFTPGRAHALVETTWPTTPSAEICGNANVLDGPATAPAGAITVPAGDNASWTETWNTPSFAQTGQTYWFEPGVHTLGIGQYSQIPAGTNATYIGAPGAIIDGQHLNQYAFTTINTGVTIRNLTVRNFGQASGNFNEGVVNHDRGADWTITHNTFINNAGASVMLGTNNVLSYNCLKDNGQYGFSTFPQYGTSTLSNITVDHNEITGNNTDDWDTQISGCGCTGGGKFWTTVDATISNNYVHDNKSVGIWADTNNAGFLVENNYIADNYGQGFFYEISYNALVRNNNFIRNGLVSGPGNAGFPTPAIYLSEAGGDSRVPNTHGYATIEVSGNNFQDNWSGVVAWEGADRFCNSPANTSSGTCTLVNPAATNSTCAEGTINNEPYYSDCRWKTQNVTVHHNKFTVNKSAISGCEAATESCGLQGLFSNYGTYPSWSPYMGSVIANAITSNQNNVFANNEYDGDWHVMAHSQGNIVSPSVWQGSSYGQDQGSTFTGGSPDTGPAVTPDNGYSKTFEVNTDGMNDWFNTTIAQSTAQAHGGTHSLAISEGSQYWAIAEDLPPAAQVTAGDVYRIEGWARASTTAEPVTMQVRWIGEYNNGISLETVASGTAATDSWNKLSAYMTAPAGATSVQLIVASSNGSNGSTMYVDDLAVTPIPKFAKTFEAGQESMNDWFNTTIAQSTAQAHGGTHSLAISEGSQYWAIAEDLPPAARLEPGLNYTLEAWVRTTATAEPVTLQVRWTDDYNNGIALDTVATATASDTSWTQLTATMTPPAGATRAALIVASANGSNGSTMYLDDMLVAPLATN